MNRLKFLLGFLLLLPSLVWGQEKVFVMEIRDAIDPRMNRYVRLALEAAKASEADLVVIDMDTYGGAVNDADEIRSMILEFDKPIFTFINKNAASAGALISIASDSIYMQKGSNIGAATVVSGGDGSQAPDKYQSYMRSMMRSTAEAQGRNPLIAEAMVDADLEIPNISEKGKVLTFSASEAVKHGFCEAIVKDLDEVLVRNNITDYTLVHYEPSWVENLISIFLNPAVSGILILVILGGIYFELQTPGIGFPLAAAITAATLYFIPYYMTGLAEYWELALLGVGLLLIAAEIFVIPGFGLAGILGMITTLSALALMMVDNTWFDFTFVPPSQLIEALVTTLTAAIAAVLMMFFGMARLGTSPIMKRISLQGSMRADEGYTTKFHEKNLVGLSGTAFTVLRPSGKVEIDGEIYDATTRGDYILKGEEIVVVSEGVGSLRVKKLEELKSEGLI